MSEDYNPFLDDSATPNEENFTHLTAAKNGPGSHTSENGVVSKDSQSENEDAAVLEPEQKYTSLEEHASSMMRSVSIEEDVDGFAALIGSDDSQSGSSRDLFVKVDKPEKHVEGYVSYNVTTKTTRGEFDQPEFNVQRRYTDFLWLRNKLEETCPTHIIPPLPEKFTFSKHFDRFDQDFLKTRQKALDKFLNRVADHPVMSFNENLNKFLTAKAWEMTTARKQSSGVMTKFGGTMKTAAASLIFKNRDPDFEHMLQFVNSYQKKVQAFGLLSDEIAKTRFYLLEDLEEYASAFHLWSNSESRLGTPLTATAFALDKNVEALKSILRVQDGRFAEPLREYNLYCDAVRNALRKRDQFQVEYEVTMEDLDKRRKEKEDIESTGEVKSIATFFGKDPEKAKEEKMAKLNEQIRDLVVESEALADRKDRADHDMKADMDRWQRYKRRDMKYLLLEMSERHVKFYESSLNAWQDALDAVAGPRARGDSEEE
ncbi:sorting nexin-7-like [Rhopilema esculentum]|uniref:sorting nexin-7-like n=1 Tax=Rhopilema esculentum TaxID=499914 RepID=UPI0031D54A18|eukprot:gene4330-20537_t